MLTISVGPKRPLKKGFNSARIALVKIVSKYNNPENQVLLLLNQHDCFPLYILLLCKAQLFVQVTGPVTLTAEKPLSLTETLKKQSHEIITTGMMS